MGDLRQKCATTACRPRRRHRCAVHRSVPALLFLVTLGGCEAVDFAELTGPDALAEGRLPEKVAPVPPDELDAVARRSFREGAYGNAARYFEQIVADNPDDGEAWLGLAASYDRIRRFDLADRAYARAEPLVGGRAAFFNNRGYSFLLRGDLSNAMRDFQKALQLSPGNPVVLNNMALVRNAAR